MARTLIEGEKPLDWAGWSKKDFLACPDGVKDEMGNAQGLAHQDYEARYGKQK